MTEPKRTFQVGDRISYYDSGFRYIGEIVEIDTSSVSESIFVNGFEHWLHPKQCRRLIKKPKKCPHPHITREMITKVWDTLQLFPSSHSGVFLNFCGRLGL